MENIPATPAPCPASGTPRGHVLVVDDDPTVAEVVVGYLDRAGYEVRRVGDAPRPWSASPDFGRTWWSSI